jgi:hypothetical protein
MALDIRRRSAPGGAQAGTRSLRLVRPAAQDALGEEFLFGSGTRPSRSAGRSRSRRRALGYLALLAALAGALYVARGAMTRQAAPVSSHVATTQLTQAAAPVAPLAIPMSVVSSSFVPDTAAGTYRATATVRNPTDLPASGIAVQATLRDASGGVITTLSRTLDLLSSGATATIDFSGELAPGAATPAAMVVTASAASLESVAARSA